jgi:hypothetical protein
MLPLVVILCTLGAARASTTTSLVSEFPCASDLECADPSGCGLAVCNLDNGFCVYQSGWAFEECSSSGCVPKRCVGGPRDNTSCIRQADCPLGSCQGFQCIGGEQDGLPCIPLSAVDTSSWTTGTLPNQWLYTACEYSGGQCIGNECYDGGELQLYNCLDNNLCTVDLCNTSLAMPERCLHAPVNCSDGDDCNGVESCDPALGCVDGQPFMPPNCDDGIGCTVDICNGTSMQCEHTYEMCQTCVTDADCNDLDPMTEDYCVTGQCQLSGAPCSECLGCGQTGGECIATALSSCVHVPPMCPLRPGPSGGDLPWWPVYLLVAILFLLGLWGVFACFQTTRRRQHDHHHGDLTHPSHAALSHYHTKQRRQRARRY